MKSSLTRASIRILLIYVLAACLAAAGAYAAGIVFRQYLRIANAWIIGAGIITVLLIWIREIPKEQQNRRKKAGIITSVVSLLILVGLLVPICVGTEQETVIEKDGEKKIEVESSWIMFLERSYFDYKNILWYEKNPHYTECFDDGRPDQLVYTDYYNSDGVLTERIFAGE